MSSKKMNTAESATNFVCIVFAVILFLVGAPLLYLGSSLPGSAPIPEVKLMMVGLAVACFGLAAAMTVAGRPKSQNGLTFVFLLVASLGTCVGYYCTIHGYSILHVAGH